MKKTKKLEIGSCGRFCQDCQFFQKICQGCRSENKSLKNKCPVYQCAKKKKIRHCLQCSATIPECRLMRSISKSYCPVVANLKLKKMIK